MYPTMTKWIVLVYHNFVRWAIMTIKKHLAAAILFALSSSLLTSIALANNTLITRATLAQSINKEAGRITQDMNKESIQNAIKYGEPASEAFRYHLEHKEIRYTDYNKDGIKDAVVLMIFCEQNNCHTTTRYSYVVFFQE